jgi:hypothetical protein
MLGWTHSGFSVDLSVKIAATSSKAREERPVPLGVQGIPDILPTSRLFRLAFASSVRSTRARGAPSMCSGICIGAADCSSSFACRRGAPPPSRQRGRIWKARLPRVSTPLPSAEPSLPSTPHPSEPTTTTWRPFPARHYDDCQAAGRSSFALFRTRSYCLIFFS